MNFPNRDRRRVFPRPSVMAASLLAGVVVLAAWGAAAAEPIVIRFSHVVSENTPKGLGAKMFKERAEKRLAGRVRVEIYPRAERYSDEGALIALVLGDLEMAAPSFSKFRGFTKKLQVFDMPFIFDDIAAVHRFQASVLGRGLLDGMAAKGLKGLAYWDNGMRAISTRGRPFAKPGDLKGLTFRIEPSAVIQTQYETLGVATIPMPFKQVKEALKLGIVDGQENAWSNINSKRLHDFQTHFVEAGHSYLGYMLVTAGDFWSGLPADVRATLETIVQEVTREVNRIAAEKAVGDRAKVVASPGVTVTTLGAAERKVWREALTPIWRRFEGVLGKDLIAAAAGKGME